MTVEPHSAGFVDLRSDTVTKPTADMRRAMAEAEVGDDCYGEDPTVNALEEAFAERLGKPAALFVPSGVMANQIALRVLLPRGSVAVAGRRQHVVAYEDAAGAVNSNVQFHTLADDDGTISPAALRWAVEAQKHHMPRPGLLCLENTHMAASGAPWALGDLEVVVEVGAGIPVHLDGARLFNAEVATGTPASSYAALATTVMCCFSKGLCAPVGSALAGSEDVIAEARVERHRLGGGMRQAGVIAAAALVGLQKMVGRLADDHDRAHVLAEAVAARWPGSGCRPDDVRTNIVVFAHEDSGALLAHLRSEGILAGTIAPGVVRLVTHADVDDADIERTRKVIASAP